MLRLRPSLCPTVSTGLEATWALAACGVILSAICAMKVPRPTMMAAKIMMLRITPHSIRGRQYDHASRKTANTGRTSGCYFDEKDERSVNGGTSSPSPREELGDGANRNQVPRGFTRR